MWRRVLLTVTVLVLVLLVGGYWWQRPLLLTGTGYAAHNACALRSIADRADHEADLPSNPLVPLLRTAQGGEESGETHTTLLGVLAEQRAWYTPGYGCTLSDDPPVLGEPTEIGAGANPFAAAPAPSPDPALQRAVDQAFGVDLPEADREDLGTRAVLVARGGELVAEQYADGFDAATPQLGWSMTKSLTNLLVGRLVHEGVVSLDEASLREEWAADARDDITIEQLLSMTSGLSWDETYALGTPITRMLYLEPDMGAYVAGREAAYEPGRHLQYSSGSTTLLCDVLAERTMDGANLPRRWLFEPLGMASAVLEPDASGTPVCSSYGWATPRDWLAAGQLALQDGEWAGEQLLPPGWMARSTTPVEAAEIEDPGYALSWWTNRAADGSLVDPGLPADAYWASGHDGQRLVVVPSEDLVVLRMGFTPEREDVGITALVAAAIAAL